MKRLLRFPLVLLGFSGALIAQGPFISFVSPSGSPVNAPNTAITISGGGFIPGAFASFDPPGATGPTVEAPGAQQ